MKLTCLFRFCVISSLLLATIVASSSIFAANDFTCNKKAKACYLDDGTLVMDDVLNFFTADGDVIATGRVTKMNGTKRTVALDKINGDVQSLAKTYSNAEATADESRQPLNNYTPKAKILAGGHVGLANFGTGDAAGFEVSAEAIKTDIIGNLDVQASAGWYHVSGTATNQYLENSKGTFSANAFTASVGPTHTLNVNGTVRVRLEAGLGFSYISALINGNAANAKSEDWGYKIESGFGVHLRGLMALAMNIGAAQLEVGYEPAMLEGSSTNTILVGAILKVK
jgi:hypothetical protein